MVRRSGSYVQDRYDSPAAGLAQPLSIDAVYSQHGETVIGDRGVFRPEPAELEPLRRREFSQRGQEDADSLLSRVGLDPDATERFYRLDDEGTYVVEFAEAPAVPDGGVGLVRPRGPLRDGGVVTNAGFVAPDDDAVEATLLVNEGFSLLAAGAVVAELQVVPNARR
jgi:hypothetical protein